MQASGEARESASLPKSAASGLSSGNLQKHALGTTVSYLILVGNASNIGSGGTSIPFLLLIVCEIHMPIFAPLWLVTLFLSRGNFNRKFTLSCREAIFVENLRTFEGGNFLAENAVV